MIDLSKDFGFGWFDSLGSALDRLTRPGFEIAAMAVVFYIVIAGFRFLMSGGDKDAIAGARRMMTHAVIGFILLMLMFLILQFLPQFFGFDFKLV